MNGFVQGLLRLVGFPERSRIEAELEDCFDAVHENFDECHMAIFDLERALEGILYGGSQKKEGC